MSDNNTATSTNRKTTPAIRVGDRRLVFWWVLLGALLGAMLVALFLAYGQPELLLEQMNLRYCG